MIVILFFVAFIILVYLFISTRRPIIVYEEPAPVTWWPWTITSYNWWPYWGGGYDTGSYGSGRRGHVVHQDRPRHESRLRGDARPWGGASRYANASAPSSGHGGTRDGHSGGHSGSRSGGHR